MQIAIVSGPAERLVRLVNLTVLGLLGLLLTSCAMTPSSEHWDPVKPSVDTPDAVAALFDGLPITVLRDEVRRLPFDGGDLYLVGVSYLNRERDRAVLPPLMEQVPGSAYSLLLYHTPDLMEVAVQEGVTLYLAGHTHGGQIRLPLFGAVITATASGKRYESGRYTVGSTTLYVNRGLGMEGKGAPRARFLCPPEIVVIDLEPNEVP